MTSSTILAGVIALCVTLLAQIAPAPVVPAFEDIRLTRNISGREEMRLDTGGGDIRRMVNAPFAAIFGAAHVAEGGVRNAPQWFHEERYDLTLRVVGTPTPGQERELWRALFAHRLKLRVRLETHHEPVYILKLEGSLGPGIHRSPVTCEQRRSADQRGEGLVARPPLRAGAADDPFSACRIGISPPGRIVTDGWPASQIAWQWEGLVGRRIVNRTGLTGDYVFTLEFAPSPGRPDIVTAIREQLGLTLEPERGPIEFVVIDHIERPEVD